MVDVVCDRELGSRPTTRTTTLLSSGSTSSSFSSPSSLSGRAMENRPPTVISVLASLLERVVARNHRHLGGGATKLTVFHGLRAPSISIEKYLERIFKYANCSPACFVVAYAYMDRFIHQQPDVPITSLNVHRLLITSVMVAAKFLDDAYYNNAYYAKVGGVSTLEMNRLELQFLFRLDFRLQVTVTMFESYCSHLEREVVCCSALVLATCCGVHRLLDSDDSSTDLRQQGSDAENKPEQQQQQQQPQQQILLPNRCSCYAGF
ncbi:cyclin-U4-1 [Selaginella moellendorffii]|uniref:cyclin-U4-1 n=1 Tax=Selaginella moellendorffii TaxID=88036 RepID=UPI000D1D0560|nr:cyclin-U4-1 [Selaginella moellendorffii]|eukprot:XP_002985239.2 cyclin-U4-1 [Selaginella moellendorffii]